MQCEKCGGAQMLPAKTFRFSAGLVVIGFVLIALSLTALGLAPLLVPRVVADGTATALARFHAVATMSQIALLVSIGIPGVVGGLLLIRRKKVWRCGGCGYGSERA
jgi:hypothetical protein